MKLHFEEEDLTVRQECSVHTSRLGGTALNCVIAKKQNQRDTSETSLKPCWIVFAQEYKTASNDALRETEQREDETMDKFIDDLEMLRGRSQPDESNSGMNLAVA